MRLFKAAAAILAATFSRMKTAVKVEEVKCGHEGASHIDHNNPQAHAQYSIGGDFCYPLIDMARRKNRRAKEMVRHNAAWRSER